jgi:hypothetical protein
MQHQRPPHTVPFLCLPALATGTNEDNVLVSLRAVAAISLVYDLGAGILLLAFRPLFLSLFALPAVPSPLHADLNAVFLIAVGLGYLMPLRDPLRHRGYMWIAGVLLKTGGAGVFVVDYLLRNGPPALLLFAASDGALALASLMVCLRARTRLDPPEVADGERTASRDSRPAARD